jgi:peroxiredoxin Q/BCP
MGDTQVKESQPAPDFTLPAIGSETVVKNGQVQLSALRGHIIVLYFYPKDDTPGCTAEACSFRDQYQVFKDAGAEVIGVSSDSVSSHKQFASKHRLPYILLSDEKGALRKRYGVPSTFGLIPGRVTYVIDREGIVRHIFSSQFTPEKHITEALKTLQANS